MIGTNLDFTVPFCTPYNVNVRVRKDDGESKSHCTSALPLNPAKSPQKATLCEEALTWHPASVIMRSGGGSCDCRLGKAALILHKWDFQCFLCARCITSMGINLVEIYSSNGNPGFSVTE